MLKVLVACEKSGRVRSAFRSRGYDAISCDILPAEDGSEDHIVGDVSGILAEPWDMVIAHPPCTYLSRAGARWLHSGGGVCQERLARLAEASSFFFMCLGANAKMIAVENPTPLRAAGLPKPSQAIQPFEFGHPYSKKTLLWLRGLPPLFPTRVLSSHKPFLPSNTGAGRRRGQKWAAGVVSSAEDASRTFTGIAEAMADQWGAFWEKYS